MRKFNFFGRNFDDVIRKKSSLNNLKDFSEIK